MMSETHTSALYYLVFVQGKSIDEGMEIIAESHLNRVRAWAALGRNNYRNFDEWLCAVIDNDIQFNGIPLMPMAEFSSRHPFARLLYD